MNRIKICLLGLMLGWTPALWAQVLPSYDFSGQKNSPAGPWLKTQGFKLERDADAINTNFEGGRLVFATPEGTLGLFGKELKLLGVRRLRVTWGVLAYPKGADWGAGKLREPISLVVSFGDEKIDSGSSFVPNMPYFLSFFLGEREDSTKVYLGNYFKKGGRYFCRPCQNPVGQVVTTEVDLAALFMEQFGRTMPPITGLTVEIDTRDTKGEAKAFVQKVEFLP